MCLLFFLFDLNDNELYCFIDFDVYCRLLSVLCAYTFNKAE